MKIKLRRPRISICIPNYNRAANLKELLLDCKNQTISPYEIIVQDDSYIESEIKSIRSVVKQFKGVLYFHNSKNLGLVKNVNKVITKATGDYIAIVNNDDRLSKRYIQEIEFYISKYNNHNVFTSNALAITDDGSVFSDYRIFNQDGIIRKTTGIKHLWNNYFLNLISVSGATIYKRRYLQDNLFETKYGNESDLNNTLKMLSEQDIFYIDKPIYYVRLNQENTSVSIRSDKVLLRKYVSNCMSIYEKYQGIFSAVPQYLIKTKTVFFLQLLVKHRFNYKDVAAVLKIVSFFELVQIVANVPGYLWHYYLRVFTFRLRVDKFRRYFPSVRRD